MLSIQLNANLMRWLFVVMTTPKKYDVPLKEYCKLYVDYIDIIWLKFGIALDVTLS